VPEATQPTSSRAPEGEIGTAHPLTVEAVGTDGGWTCFCQARADTDGDGRVEVRVGPRGELSGDRLERYFALGSGEGEPIEELAAVDPTGRWVVLRRAGKLVLFDTVSRRESELSDADARNDELPFRQHRSLSFDGSGSLLAYLSTKRGAVVRTLATGQESLIDPGPGDVWRLELDFGGRFLLLRSITSDTNGDHRMTWPAPVAKAPAPCRAPLSTYAAWVGHGDTPTLELAPASGGPARARPGFVAALGDATVERENDGRLVLRDGTAVSELAPAACGARVVHADRERHLLVVACARPKGRPKLWLVGAGERLDLRVSLSAAGSDRPPGPPSRLVALYPGSDTLLLDLETRRSVKVNGGGMVLATHGTVALVRRKRVLLLVDGTDGSERVLAGDLSPSLESFANGAVAFAAPWVVSLEAGKVLGRIEGRAYALAPNGRALVARGGDADADRLAVGPLAWLSPVASP
jgi:hypothetical protein